MGSPPRYEDDDLDRFEEFWRDERAAARLYRGLAAIAGDERRGLFERLAATEERHARHWADLLADAGVSRSRSGSGGASARCCGLPAASASTACCRR